ncbi:DMT family transporter [Microlunatus capsulatus]|uniref:Drug/metabolite transporter (DMT)-like permease n=1 Tax=Microlunatus capsulatus TaxID=99117 RepID=A0ABS4ZBB7_9ACTN|nr:DMT family transporter [Microlunatus capsulatus]MBP2418368.1 drug/metabolite transporter (DMT)-like permease [Microlunatus capsulatus]
MPPPSRTRSDLAPLLALLAMTAAWGSTFFLIKDLLVRLPVADMLALRFGIGSLALVLLAGRRLRMSRSTLRSGVLLGLLYGVAQILQTAGLAHTSASVSGFITGLYVVATPLLAALLLRTRVSGTTWAAASLATVGLGVLSLNGFALGAGELLTLASALVYAGHIIAMGRLSTPGEALPLSLVQMVVITVVCTVAAVWPGAGGAGLQLPATSGDWLAVLYLAVVAGALTMVLQTWAQARVEAARAAVVMAMEPVWAAAFAVALGGERLTLRMVAGGIAILAAMYLVELAPRRRRRVPVAGPAAPVDAVRDQP